MANYADTYYEEVDALFNEFKAPPFQTLPDPLPQDSFGVIQPVGWVENADGVDGTAKVIINSEGITILDGKIFLSDYGGTSVLSPAGFAGSWIGFINDRVYNSQFGYGTVGPLTVSEVGGADTEAEYLSSLSASLPYWIISATSGLPDSFSLRSEPGTPFGKALQCIGSTFDATFYQDVPIVAGNVYTILYNIKYAADPAAAFNLHEIYSYRDADHAIIGAETSSALAYTTTQGSYRTQYFNTGEEAPSGAVYLRVKFRLEATSGSAAAPQVLFVGVSIREATKFGPIYLEAPLSGLDLVNLRVAGESFSRLTLSSSGSMSLGSGSAAADVQLSRTAANVLTLGAGDRFDNEAVGYRVRKTTAQSIGSGAWSGPSGFTNTDWVGLGVSWNVAGSGGLTANVAGVYVVNVAGEFAGSAAGGRRVIGFSINGGVPAQYHHQSFPFNANSTYMNGTWIVPLAAGDIVRLMVYQDSGAAINIEDCLLGMARIGLL